MPAAVIPRDEAIERILAVFREHGYEGASLSRLSEATGLGRSSLYHHFPNGKEDMAKAALASVHAWLAENVIATLQGDARPLERLHRFSEAMIAFYGGGKRPCLTDIFTMGEAGAIFRPHLAAGTQVLIRTLASVVEEAGIASQDAARRAEDAVIAIQGSLVVSRALGDTAPFHRVIRELPAVLLRQ